MAPVIRLAGQVRHRDQLIALAPALHPDYADDARLGRWRCLSTRHSAGYAKP
jgi:hypothetical protein